VTRLKIKYERFIKNRAAVPRLDLRLTKYIENAAYLKVILKWFMITGVQFYIFSIMW
jgi:hypothetical protein